jgi:hypothetical protein
VGAGIDNENDLADAELRHSGIREGELSVHEAIVWNLRAAFGRKKRPGRGGLAGRKQHAHPRFLWGWRRGERGVGLQKAGAAGVQRCISDIQGPGSSIRLTAPNGMSWNATNSSVVFPSLRMTCTAPASSTKPVPAV